MIDLIVYCPDTGALVDELRAMLPKYLDEEDMDNPRFLVDKTPTRRNGDETLAVVRWRDDDPGVRHALEILEIADVIKVLGTWEELSALPKTSDEWKLYKKVHPRTVRKYKDEDGKERTHKPAEEIGRFA